MSLGKAKSEAQRIIKLSSITKPNELSIEDIVYFINGPQIVFEDFKDCEGKFLGSSNVSLIMVSSNIKNEERKKFTIAHELGHYILHRDNVFIKCTTEDFQDWASRKQIESEANYFASELLMPTDIFSTLTRNKKFSVDFLKEIAQKFETSLTSTAIKFVESGDDPIFLICSRSGIIEWKFASKNFEFFIDFRNLKRVPQESVTFELINQKADYKEPQEIDPRYWLISNVESEFRFYEDVINSECYGYTLSFIYVR